MDEALTKTRRIAIVVVILLLVGGLIATALPSLHVCRDRIAQTGDAGVATVCEPLLGEVGLVGLTVLLIVLILLPLLSKFDIAGLVSIEMKAEEARKEAGEARELAGRVERHTNELAEVQAEIRRIQEQFLARALLLPSDHEWRRRVEEAVGSDEQPDPEESARRGLLVENLLRIWAELSAFLSVVEPIGHQRAEQSAAVATQAGRLAVTRWRNEVALEVEQVRAVRNRVAHGVEVSTQELERAVELGDTILRAVQAAVRQVE